MNRLVFRYTTKRSGHSLSTDLARSPDQEGFRDEMGMRMHELMQIHAMLHPGVPVVAVQALMWDPRYAEKYRPEPIKTDIAALNAKLQEMEELGETEIRAQLRDVRQKIAEFNQPDEAADEPAEAEDAAEPVPAEGPADAELPSDELEGSDEEAA